MIPGSPEESLTTEYLEWMYDLVCDDQYSKGLSYHTLFENLNRTSFDYSLPMDGNRAEDGTDLRYIFGREKGYAEQTIAAFLDIQECSVLEMMIALALRVENQIMNNPDVGNRAGQWFWEMIVTLGLNHMDDTNFSYQKFDQAMERFINREYKRNGDGGLFKIKNRSIDMRDVEIWYQMQYYLNELLED